jgi:glutathione S-transferase
MSLKPLIVYGHWGGPNPWYAPSLLLMSHFLLLYACRKVAIILAELNIPYEWKELEFNEVKNPSYTKINPNGRLPAIGDPNTGITLWEV